jgi:tripartite-type tricarboxylate transporter receptor subunit TctC
MKLKTLFALISFGVFTSAAVANQRTVQVVWPFAPASSQAVMVRNLLEAANKQQNKYQFVFVNKPGAGGAIAANYVSSSPQLTVLASTSSFYTRPLLYTESHDPEQFRLVNTICMHGPLAMFSRKYSFYSEIKNSVITVGIIPGSVTQLFTRILAQHNPELKFTEVPYKNTPEATTDMLGKHIDVSLDLLSTTNLAKLTSDTSVIGVSGTRSFPAMPSMSSLKVKGLENLTNSYYIFLPKHVDMDTYREISQLFNNSIDSAVRESCNNEKGVVEITTHDKADKLHQATQARWKQITGEIVKQ